MKMTENLDKISKIINLEVDLDEVNSRLDVFVANLVPELTRTRVQQLIKSEETVFVNNKPSKNSYKLKYGDEVCIKIPEAKPLEMEAENIPLDVRYEDEDMLVVNKPAGMLTHPTSIEREHTLVNALLFHCKGNLSGINGIMRPGILHRLDRDTSGLLMVAKNDFAHQFLAEQIKTKTAIRQYLAILLGIIAQDEGTIDAPIDRHLTQRHKMGVVEGGKPAVTHWKVLERFEKFTFIEATLQTGRTHQIRVHFSNISHPVAGDPLYGGDNLKIKLKGQALQAYRLSFFRPSDKKQMVIELEPDDDIKKMLKYLRN
jgi:23S rRNA pseudouridine1911/1915/1917 synthase